MPVTQSDIDSIASTGQALYDRDIRPLVETEHRGKFLVLDINTGAYEIDADQLQAFSRAIARNPNGNRYLVRIGYAAAYRLGGHIGQGRA